MRKSEVQVLKNCLDNAEIAIIHSIEETSGNTTYLNICLEWIDAGRHYLEVRAKEKPVKTVFQKEIHDDDDDDDDLF